MIPHYSGCCNRVFEIFNELAGIPHGSGNMSHIAAYCVEFANKLGLRVHRDTANNVVIYKPAAAGCEHAAPVILQGHLDMVCQKTADCSIDFLTEGITVLRDGDFLHADGTTLGADNGIAVAMILWILERNDVKHPPLEAVFTTDEEVGMVGAFALDTSLLSGKQLINLDSEDDDTVTVSCAGGADFSAKLPLSRVNRHGTAVELSISGLQGGHSGVEIHRHRANAAMLVGRLLNELAQTAAFDMVYVNAGDKANAIPHTCTAVLVTPQPEFLLSLAHEAAARLQRELACREAGLTITVSPQAEGDYAVFSPSLKDDVLYALTCAPNGIIEMSAEIEGLVQTSLNLGVLATEEEHVLLRFALRSNKSTALKALEEKLQRFFSKLHALTKASGHYPPWEYCPSSVLQQVYIQTYTRLFGEAPKVEAIHAGLECAVFSSALAGADCIAMGPTIMGAHTTAETLSISSTEKTVTLLLEMLQTLAN